MRWARRLDPVILGFASQKASRFTLQQPTQILLVTDSQFAEEAPGILNFKKRHRAGCSGKLTVRTMALHQFLSPLFLNLFESGILGLYFSWDSGLVRAQGPETSFWASCGSEHK